MKKNYSSTYHPTTLVPLLYQCVETRSIEVSLPLSQPPLHLSLNPSAITETFASQQRTTVRDKHFPT
jgi:hypothetical protein